jgi:flagellin-like hook-associated protein FlgL
VNYSKITALQIDQANFGTHTSIGIEINVVQQATRGTLNYAFGAIAENLVLQVGGAHGTEAFNFAANSTIEEIASAVNLVSDATGVEAVVEQEATQGQVTISSFGEDNDIVLTANEAGFDAGDLRVIYTKGNSSSTTATYTAPLGSEPGRFSVALQTSAYEAATLTIDQAGDDNAFTITANVAGAGANGINVVLAAGGTAGAETATFDGSTLTVTIEDTVSTAAQVVAAINNAATNPEVAELFTAALVEQNNGGAGTIAAAAAGSLAGGSDGGEIVATANDVIAAINAAAGNDVATASLAEGNDGHEAVTLFQDFAYYGSAVANNRLQFLAPDNAPKVRFVSTPGTALSIDTETDPKIEGYASYTVQNEVANGTFTIRARNKGGDYDGYTINIVDNANVAAASNEEFVVLDKENKTLTVHIEDGVSTAQDIIDTINNDTYVNQFFEADNFGTSTGAGVVTVADLTLGDTTGGLVSPGTLIINLETDENGIIKTTANDLIDFFNDPNDAPTLATLTELGISVTNAEGSDGTGLLAATTSDLTFATSGTELEDAQASGTTTAVNGLNAQITITAINAGDDYNDVQIVFEDDPSVTAGNETVEYDATNKILTVHIEDGVSTADQVIAAINADDTVGDLFSADEATGGDGTAAVTVDDYATLSGGVVDNGSTYGAALLGNSDLANVGLTFQATQFGSAAFVELKALSGSFSLTNTDGDSSERSHGLDLDARVNGIQAVGKGLSAAINTASVDLTFSVAEDVADGETLTFNITGGGAQFQLGPSVVSNQQARIGIQSVNSSRLGGVNGHLFELRSGGAKSLTTDVGGAARVVDEVISIVTGLRGRLGAFQKTTLESNIFTLNDTLANLTEAESSIRDADFAKESAKLTRAQILSQSTTSVLAIANSNPQNVLALLR